MLVMSTSLNVVNMAELFLASTSLDAIVRLIRDIFSLLVVLPNDAALGTGATGPILSPLVGFGAGVAPAASCLVILPPTPVPCTSLGAMPFSASIFAADGDGCPAA